MRRQTWPGCPAWTDADAQAVPPRFEDSFIALLRERSRRTGSRCARRVDELQPDSRASKRGRRRSSRWKDLRRRFGDF